VRERLGIAGSGAIACGLAATGARHGDVLLWARSDASAQRAEASVHKVCGRLQGEVNAARVKVVTDLEALGDATVVVEAIAEDADAKAALYGALPDGDGRCWRPPRPRCPSSTSPRPPGAPSASSACTSSTRCRG
jgi:3-hydroxybutyryl-CoA dehydrogenase